MSKRLSLGMPQMEFIMLRECPFIGEAVRRYHRGFPGGGMCAFPATTGRGAGGGTVAGRRQERGYNKAEGGAGSAHGAWYDKGMPSLPT